ncbi:FAD-dependent oxidoreductase [Candidatus Berkiella aquae]|uniref:FAD-dependent oxidoreductase n=1 Tax=Candidatus Berkiella aquae TaxID=295108 RepID=A0A0Q9YWH0_9GAMM|nr:FAD-dependent oxidoreductase [Candidatus Berkiella aquae]MCS5710069.1 FAD-dependent oxidoreductase [Candidatus Berkiella aquae]
MTQSLPIVIIGTGLAGYSVAKEFRKLDTHTPLILLTQDDGHFYSKPLLSTAMHQAKSPQDLIITDVALMQQQLNATILTYSNVEHIDTLTQTLSVQTDNHLQNLAYQKLVFAMGANPKPLPIIEKLHSHYRINSLMDYAKFKNAQASWQHLTIIGSGLVGCEFAHDFTKSHLSIEVITPDPYPLYGLVPEPVGDALRASLAEKGVSWHTKAHVTEATQNHDCYLSLSNGKTLQTNAVLVAIGLAPHIAIAKTAGLSVNQGIVVNSFLESSVSNHYALGDCAEYGSECRQYVSPILVCARALAQTLNGNPTQAVLPNLPVSLKVDCYPIITAPPKRGIEGSWQFENLDNHYQGLFYDKLGVLQGYVLSGSFLAKRQEFQAALNTK